MSLTDEYSSGYSEEDIQKHGKKLLDKYGPEACNAAATLDDAGLQPSTARSYKPQVRQVLSACDNTRPTPRAVVDHISEVDKSSDTKSLMVSAMQRYYNIIGEVDKAEELSRMADAEGVAKKDYTEESPISGWLTKEEVLNIEEHILPEPSEKHNRLSFPDATWVITAEHRALVMTLFYTGCRVGEVCQAYNGDEALSVEDIYPDSNEIELYRLKKGGSGYKRDMTPVPGKLIDALHDYMQIEDIEEGALFPFTTRTAQKRVKEIGQAYKHAFGEFEHTDKLTPHKLRHSRITDIANNAGLEQAGQYVDHSNPETTNQYRHVTGEEQRDVLPEESGADDPAERLMEKLGVDSIDEAAEKIDELTEDQ